MVLNQQVPSAWHADGELWFVRSGLDRTETRFKNRAGFELIRRLIEAAGSEVRALDLFGAIELNGTIEVADRQTLVEFRRRLGDLDIELDEASRFNDPYRVESLQTERDALVRALKATLGLHNRQRTSGGDAERARVRATRSIRAVIELLEGQLPLLAADLKRHIRTGNTCSYTGDPHAWILRPELNPPSIEPLAQAGADGQDGPHRLGLRSGSQRLSRPSEAGHPFQAGHPAEDGERSLEARDRHRWILNSPHLNDPEPLPWFGAANLSGYLSGLHQPDRHVLLVSGNSGAGKSRFVREAQRSLAAAGVLVMSGSNDDRYRSPFQPFERAFTELIERHRTIKFLGGPAFDRLHVLFPHLSNATGGVGEHRASSSHPNASQAQTVDSIVEALRAISKSVPTTLVIEDLQFATDDTVSALAAVIQRTRVGVVISYDSTKVPPSHPSHRLLAELVTGPDNVQTIELRPLTTPEIVEAIETILPPSIGPRSAIASWVQARTNGNPLLAIEVIRGLATVSPVELQRTIRQQDVRLDSVHPTSGFERTRLKQIVRGRLSADFPLQLVQLLQRAAVLGQDFELTALAALTEQPQADVLHQLAPALERGTIVLLRKVPLRFRFATAVVREVLYEEQPELERILLHLKAGDHLAGTLPEGEPDRAAHLAYHYGHGAGMGSAADALRYALLAGDAAFDRNGFADAAGWYAYAEQFIDSAHHKSAADSERLEVLIKRGVCETRSGLPSGRQTLLRGAETALQFGRMDLVRTAALEANRGLFSQALTADSGWIDVIESALQSAEDPDTEAELRAVLASEMLWADEQGRRFALSDRALASAREHGSSETLARVLFGRGHTVAAAHSWRQRVAEADEHLEAATESGDDLLVLQAMQSCASAMLAAGDAHASMAFGEEMVRRADRLGFPVWKFMASIGKVGYLVHEAKLNDATKAVGTMFSLGMQAGYDADALSFAADLSVAIARWRDALEPMVVAMADIASDPAKSAQVGYLVGPRLLDAGDLHGARRVLDTAVERGLESIPTNFMQFSAWTHLAYLTRHLADDRLALGLLREFGDLDLQFPCTTTTGPCATHSKGLLFASLGDHERAHDLLGRASTFHAEQGAPLLALESDFEACLALIDLGKMDRATQSLKDVMTHSQRANCAFLVRRAESTLAALDVDQAGLSSR